MVAQLHPSQPAGESCLVDARYNLHDKKATVSLSSTSTFHEWPLPSSAYVGVWYFRAFVPSCIATKQNRRMRNLKMPMRKGQ